MSESKVVIQIGQVFGHLVVQELTRLQKGSQKHLYALCLCGCGGTILARPCNLDAGRVRSCGCKIGKSLIGAKFAKFTVTGQVATHKTSGRMWECLCECGSVRFYSSAQVRSKKISECLDCYNKRISKYEPVGEITRGHWAQIVKNAVIRNLPFEVSCEFVWSLFLKQDRKCVLSGESLVFATSVKSTGNSASLDRIDSDLGYTENNVQWVHKDINSIKSKIPDPDFIRWCEKVAAWQQSKR